MKALLIVFGIIALGVIVGVVVHLIRRKKMISDWEAMQYMANLNRRPGDSRYHLVTTLTDEELGWLMKYYDDQIKTRYHKVAGGMLVERSSEFELQVERDLEKKLLSDAQIDDINSRLFQSMQRLERYNPELYKKMESIRQRLNLLKSEFTIQI